ncbi:MAG TPA: hypothetical protein VG435_09690, partial [Acidimicrobiales bacterium]|nr:hypothetical protein [Acidimicrobiales bacterium]
MASVGTAQAVTVVAATGTVSSKLQPGGSADLTLTINNPNSYAVTVIAVQQSGPITVSGGSGCTSDSGSEPSLTLGNSGVSVSTQSGLAVSVPSGSGQAVHIANGATMTTASDSGC